MRIIGARWTRSVNLLAIACLCGEAFVHRADRWLLKCPRCGESENLADLRTRFFEEHTKP